jgi:hypothetical protein
MFDDESGRIRGRSDISFDLYKGKLSKEQAKVSPKSHFVDPFAISNSIGYKDHRYSPSFDLLNAIPGRLAVVAAIIQTRCNQVAAFSVPFRHSKSVGFQIKMKDVTKHPSPSQKKYMEELEEYIYRCGNPRPNKFFPKKRDSFEDFLKKIVRQTLILDQVCVEIVPDRVGRPYEFLAVDAATIRMAAPNLLNPNEHDKVTKTKDYTGQDFNKFQNEFDPDAPAYVQLLDGKVVNTYTEDELVFAIRNPRADLRVQGYGYSELEQIINTITAHLNAEDYNRRAFTQGAQLQGILNFKGDAMAPEMLEAFKREWRDTLEGVQNSFRTPILQAEQGIEWVSLKSSNREMEYGQWLEYLLKLVTSVYLIDPAELNFDLHGGVQNTPLFESTQEWKLKASRDKGLRPLLKFIAKILNDHIVAKIDDNYVLTFEGLDELTEKDKHDLRKEQVATYRTLNEIRAEQDLPSLPYGDMPMNPTYIQGMQATIQQQQQEQQSQQSAGGAGQQSPDGNNAQQNPTSVGSNTEQQERPFVPSYSM